MYYIKKNKLAFYSICLLMVIIGFIGAFLLPERFFYDANFITQDPLNQRGWIESYPVTIMFYHLTRLSYIPYAVVALIQLPILYYILKIIGIPNNFHIINIKNIIVYLSFLMIAIFIGVPSKEFITYLFVFFCLCIITQKRIDFNLLLAFTFILFILFGIVYRPYYIFIPFVSIAMYGVTFIKIKNKVLFSVFIGILVIIFISLTHGILKGSNLSDLSRQAINLQRIGSDDANSMILSPIDPSSWYGESFSAFYGFFTVNFPINGLKYFKSPQIIAFVVWQLILSWILLVRFSRCLNNRKEKKVELWVLIILFSYFVIQGIFEPDLGSAVRHKIGVFPLIYYSLYYDCFGQKLSKRI